MNAGFYKFDGGVLLYGPNFVLNSNYELWAEAHKEHSYPIDGWYWFESEDDAYRYFEIPKPEIDDIV